MEEIYLQFLTLVVGLIACISLLVVFIFGTFKRSSWAPRSAKAFLAMVVGSFVYWFYRPLGTMLVAGGLISLWFLYLAHYLSKRSKTPFDHGKLAALFFYLFDILLGFILHGELGLINFVLNLLCIVTLGISYLLSKE